MLTSFHGTPRTSEDSDKACRIRDLQNQDTLSSVVRTISEIPDLSTAANRRALKADIVRCSWHVANVPTAEVNAFAGPACMSQRCHFRTHAPQQTTLPSLGRRAGRSCLSTSDFRRTTGAIDAANRRAVGCRVSCDIEICSVTLFRRKLRIRQQGKPGDGVEGCFGFIPLDAGVLDPEAGVPMLTPICHLVGVEKLNSKIETAHLAILLEVPD
jgi:hypothetical protein